MRLWRKLTWEELKLFVREPLTVVFAIGFPLIMLFVLAEVFGTAPVEPDPGDPIAFRGVSPLSYYVPAYVALAAAAVGLVMVPAHLAAYRERGVLRRFRAASIPASTVFAAQIAVQYVLAAAGGLLIIAAAYLAYDFPAPEAFLGPLVAFFVTATAFAALGILLGAVMPSPRAAQGFGVMLFFVMMMLSGAGPPVDVMTSTMQGIGKAMPLWHGVIALQDAWLGYGWNWGELGIVAAVAVVAGALAVASFRRRA
ncbi:MAG: ABC transporter permease [Thermoleophilia bacterium]